MSLGEWTAVTLQTILIVLFIAIMIPFRFSFKKTVLILGGFAVILCVMAGCIATWKETAFLASYGYLLLGTPLFLMFRLLSKVKGFRFLFIVITAIFCHQTLSTLLAAFRIWAGGGFTLLYLLMSLVAFGLLLAGGLTIRKDFHKIVFTYRYEFISLTLILTLLLGMSVLFTPVSPHRYVLDPDLLLITLGIDLLALLLYLYVGVSFHSLGKLCDETRETTALRLQMEQTQNHITLLRENQEKAAFYRHDLRHHLSLIRAFLDSGETDKLRAYLDEVQAGLNNDTPDRYCQNEAVNLLLISFAAKAADAGVRLLVDAQIPLSLPISNPEFCTLLSNALENAVMATAKTAQCVEKTVSLMARLTDGKLLLLVENPYPGELCMENGLPWSDRPSRVPAGRHGLGIASMESIVKKYGGLSSFEAADGVFTVRIVI